MLVVTFFSNDAAPTEIYTLSLHDALPISTPPAAAAAPALPAGSPLLGRPDNEAAAKLAPVAPPPIRSEEHTSELQSQSNLVCRLLLEKKKGHLPLPHRTSPPSHHRSPSVC